MKHNHIKRYFMRNIYERRERLRLVFILASVALVCIFLLISNTLMKSLEQEERSKMEIWAEATRQLASVESESDMSLVLKVIQSNTTIPVVILDDTEAPLWYINFDVPKNDSTTYMQRKINELKNRNNLIEVVISDNMSQYLYYDDSVLLKRLSYYPYIQLIILLLFILLGLFAFDSTKKAEQNQVWVGLSKETAHQLGTPISSLMAWIQYLGDNGNVGSDIIIEMDKDVVRLKTIADRFSKIGSEPQLEECDLNEVLLDSIKYMSTRVSKKTAIKTNLLDKKINMKLCAPLFEWVIENLFKNSIDAINGHGEIIINEIDEGDRIILEITDNGKGIPKKNFKTVFRPGYTTKKRGWGLGLTLVKRIIENYHHGKIYVKESVPNKRTTFCIELKTDKYQA